MSAAETLAAAQAEGVRFGLDGADLLIESELEPARELLDALRRDKLEIQALLRNGNTGEVSAPVTATKSQNLHGLTPAELEEAADENWPEVRVDPAMLEALAYTVVARRQRERGQCPPHWTEHCECAGCGPVYLWSGSPARVFGCPWCSNRSAGFPIPRPGLVRCGDCEHWGADAIGGGGGIGTCAVGGPRSGQVPAYPYAKRACDRWLPVSVTQEECSSGR